MVRTSSSVSTDSNHITMKSTTTTSDSSGVGALQATSEAQPVQDPFSTSLSWSCSSSSLDQGGVEGSEKRRLGRMKDSAMTRSIFRSSVKHEAREDADDHCTSIGLEETESRRESSSLYSSNVETEEGDLVDARDSVDGGSSFVLASPPRFRNGAGSAMESPKRVVGCNHNNNSNSHKSSSASSVLCPPHKKSCRSWIKMANPIRQQSSLDYPYSSVHVTPEFDALSIFRSYSAKPAKGATVHMLNKAMAREKRQEQEEDLYHGEGGFGERSVVQPNCYNECDVDRIDIPDGTTRPCYYHDDDEESLRDDGSIGPDTPSPSPSVISVEEVKMATPVRSSSVTFLTAEMSTGGLPLFPFLPTTTDGDGVTVSTSVKCGDQLLEWADAIPEESSDFCVTNAAAKKNLSYLPPQPPDVCTALTE